jgi:hypothetical protein
MAGAWTLHRPGVVAARRPWSRRGSTPPRRRPSARSSPRRTTTTRRRCRNSRPPESAGRDDLAPWRPHPCRRRCGPRPRSAAGEVGQLGVAGREDIARDREVDRVDRRREHLARTVRAWEAESLAFHCHQWLFQRAYRGADLLIKKVKRVGHGFRNFTNYGCGCSCTAASGGRLTGPRDCEAALHAWWHRAPLRPSSDARNANLSSDMGAGLPSHHMAEVCRPCQQVVSSDPHT